MILALVLFLTSAGIWRQSRWFLLWALLLVTPAWLFMAKVYKERELELLFGEAYRDYWSKTPFLLPRRPRQGAPAEPGAPPDQAP